MTQEWILSDENAVAHSLADDPDAFNRFVLEYQNQAYEVAYYLLYDEGMASDVVQNSFVRAFQSLESPQPGSFRKWLMRLVTTRCCDLLSELKCELTPGGATFQLSNHYRPPNASERRLPPSAAKSTAAIQHLLVGIQQLPSEQRVALLLKDKQGFSYAEIAEIRGIAVGTAKSYVSSARVHLRDWLVQGGCLP